MTIVYDYLCLRSEDNNKLLTRGLPAIGVLNIRSRHSDRLIVVTIIGRTWAMRIRNRYKRKMWIESLNIHLVNLLVVKISAQYFPQSLNVDILLAYISRRRSFSNRHVHYPLFYSSNRSMYHDRCFEGTTIVWIAEKSSTVDVRGWNPGMQLIDQYCINYMIAYRGPLVLPVTLISNAANWCSPRLKRAIGVFVGE